MSEVNISQASLEEHALRYKQGDLQGADLAQLEKDGSISKSDRRKIVKLAAKLAEAKELTQRQKLRLEVKQKKQQPRQRLSYEERKDKFSDLDEKLEERNKMSSQNVVCLGCRKRGHYLKDCPQAKTGSYDGSRSSGGGMAAGRTAVHAPTPTLEAAAANSSGNGGAGGSICFNCGSPDHALRACHIPRDPKGVLKYASCFVCKQQGHLSRDCPNNLNGIYAKGGCCHICRQTDHLVRDCPQRTEEDKANWIKQQEAEKQRKEDEKYGPRIQGLVEGDGGDVGGDAHMYESSSAKGRGEKGQGGMQGADDEDEEKPSKKEKKRKSSSGSGEKKSKKEKR